MGFDLSIIMSLQMCPAAGKPFWYKFNPDTKLLDKCYELPDIQVPSKMCEYLQLRGRFLHAYTDTFNEIFKYEANIHDFLEKFPSWERVKAHEEYDESWIEEDHLGFLRLLEWCSNQCVEFHVTWSF